MAQWWVLWVSYCLLYPGQDTVKAFNLKPQTGTDKNRPKKSLFPLAIVPGKQWTNRVENLSAIHILVKYQCKNGSFLWFPQSPWNQWGWIWADLPSPHPNFIEASGNASIPLHSGVNMPSKKSVFLLLHTAESGSSTLIPLPWQCQQGRVVSWSSISCLAEAGSSPITLPR